jgi:hypothetical protein
MIGFQRQRQMFAAQFQPQGEGFVYRKHSIGEPIRISAADRDRFIADFETFTRQGFWAMVAGSVVLVAIFVGLWYATATQVPDTVFYLVFGAMLLLYMAGSFRAWNRPLRELNERG